MTLPNSNTRIEQYLSEISKALKALSGSSQSAKMYYSIESAQILYFNEDGSELLHTEPVAVGDSGMWDGAPEKEPDEKYEYTFQGWAKEPNKSSVDDDAVENVTSTRKVYAVYKKEGGQVDYLTFRSAARFGIGGGDGNIHSWDGKLYYSYDTETWDEVKGLNILSEMRDGEYVLYLRGEGNTSFAAYDDHDAEWYYLHVQGGDAPLECTGNIETLLDYQTVARGEHPVMAGSCFAHMFESCTSLTVAPTLPAATLASSCYESMFAGCTSLASVPEMNAITFPDRCCYGMFSGCSKIKVSSTETEEYSVPYRIPASGDGVAGNYAFHNMFAYTGGTFTGTPQINTTYYLANQVVPAAG